MQKKYSLLCIYLINLLIIPSNYGGDFLKKFQTCLTQAENIRQWPNIREQLFHLHQLGISINEISPDKKSNSLFWACTYSDKTLASWLLRNGANPNIQYNNPLFSQPLFTVSNVSMARLLLAYEAKLYVFNELGHSLLNQAINPKFECTDLLKFYLESGLLPKLLPDQGISLWHQLVNVARYYPAEIILPRAHILEQLHVPNLPELGKTSTPEEKIIRELKNIERSFDPSVFSQGPKLHKLLTIIQKTKNID